MKTRAQGSGPATAEVPIYRTEEARAGLMAIYDQRLREWPVPFDTVYVTTRARPM